MVPWIACVLQYNVLCFYIPIRICTRIGLSRYRIGSGIDKLHNCIIRKFP